ncbi:Hypothetical predicted protein [Olea europaea subsp. europaea]|uniref:Regulator of rDNA transcription protein 15 n=1 Tax=Olea europaea subsp. europaea TaxID=158383 RepID=A0A8S0SJN5_OLEEU|nr:Hypothetical predicted protein [Olea europaea subsp. europaea]
MNFSAEAGNCYGCYALLAFPHRENLDWEERKGRDESEGQRAESQRIVAARPLCHLQYPVSYLSRLQRILPAARWKLYFKAANAARSLRGLGQRYVPLGAVRPLLWVGKRTAGVRIASSPDSNLEAFSHNSVHGSIAPLAFQPSAMTNCANQRFLSFKFRRSKGSLGHAFTVRIRTGNQNQTSFYPSVPHEISVLVELILGHLRYLLTDVPPQLNSTPDNVFRPDWPAKRALEHWAEITLREHPQGPSQCFVLIKQSDSLVRTSSESTVRRPGKAPEGAVPSPSPDRHAATRSHRGSRAVHRQPTGSRLGPPCPALRANPFSEVTDPFCQLSLPTLFH